VAVLHTSVFYIIPINVNSLSPARNNCICALFVPVGILYSQPLLQSPNHPESFSHGWPLWGLQRGGNVWERDMCCMAGGEEQPLWILWLLPSFSKLYVVLRCLVGGVFQQRVWGQSLVTRIYKGFKSLDVQIWGNCLTTWHNVYRSHTFCIPPNPQN
jgi:hypothetical protein